MFKTLTVEPARLIVVLPLPALLNVAVSAAPGTVAGLQLVFVFQLEFVVPFHCGSPPAGGIGLGVVALVAVVVVVVVVGAVGVVVVVVGVAVGVVFVVIAVVVFV
jgi:hypothetical protein